MSKQPTPKILVVGDLMLDEFVYGHVDRISPEAATPVLSVTRTDRMFGGAGNVARNVVALGGRVHLVGVIGSDHAANVIADSIPRNIAPDIVTIPGRVTTVKRRLVSEDHHTHLLRLDTETTAPITDTDEARVLDRALDWLDDSDIVVLSDYCKGVVTRRIAREIISAALRHRKRVIVDSKRADLSRFCGAWLVKLNTQELLGRVVHDADAYPQMLKAASELTDRHMFSHALVTRGEHGMTLFSRADDQPRHFPAETVRVRDVSGAGDTVVASLAVTAARGGASLSEAVEIANHAASIAVGKLGTATVSEAELIGGKVVSADRALLTQKLNEWRGERIGFVNGCFDLMHSGHLHLLRRAAAQSDKVIVGLNSDASVKRLKGDDRPIHGWQERAKFLASLDTVDLVVVFEDDEPIALIETIRPDAIFVGSDHADYVSGREHAKAVVMVDRIGTNSTTDTINRVRNGNDGSPAVKHSDTCGYPAQGCTCRAWETGPLG